MVGPFIFLDQMGPEILRAGKGLDVDAIAPEIDGRFMSAFVRAVKPA